MRGAETWGGGGGACKLRGTYKQQFTVPGLKTTNDLLYSKNRGVKITDLSKTTAKKLSKTSQVFTLRITPLFSITYLWVVRRFLFFEFFF